MMHPPRIRCGCFALLMTLLSVSSALKDTSLEKKQSSLPNPSLAPSSAGDLVANPQSQQERRHQRQVRSGEDIEWDFEADYARRRAEEAAAERAAAEEEQRNIQDIRQRAEDELWNAIDELKSDSDGDTEFPDSEAGHNDPGFVTEVINASDAEIEEEESEENAEEMLLIPPMPKGPGGLEMEAGEPRLLRQQRDHGPAGKGQIRCLKEANLLALNPPFDFRALLPRHYDQSFYPTFRDVCAREAANSPANAGCYCKRKAMLYGADWVDLTCTPHPENRQLYTIFRQFCGAHCDCKTYTKDWLEVFLDRFRPVWQKDKDPDPDDGNSRGPNPSQRFTTGYGLKFVFRGKEYPLGWKLSGGPLENSGPIYLPISPWALRRIRAAELADRETCAASDMSCKASEAASFLLPDEPIEPNVCGSTCQSNNDCSAGGKTGCVCQADIDFLTAKAKGLDWNYPAAACILLSRVLVNPKQHHRPGYAGLLGRDIGDASFDTEAEARKHEDLMQACVCNSTYISKGCCDAPDGMIWEDRGLKLASLDYEL